MDVRRELVGNNAEIRRFERVYKHRVKWYLYSEGRSTVDPVYDTGPERRYLPGQWVPSIWIGLDDPDWRHTSEGRIKGRILTAAFNVRTLVDRGILAPEEAFDRERDVLEFQGDFYEIREYEPSGMYGDRQSNQQGQLNIEVKAVQRFDFDTPMDSLRSHP